MHICSEMMATVKLMSASAPHRPSLCMCDKSTWKPLSGLLPVFDTLLSLSPSCCTLYTVFFRADQELKNRIYFKYSLTPCFVFLTFPSGGLLHIDHLSCYFFDLREGHKVFQFQLDSYLTVSMMQTYVYLIYTKKKCIFSVITCLCKEQQNGLIFPKLHICSIMSGMSKSLPSTDR